MSKQYLTTHSHTLPHPSNQTDVFALASSAATSTLLIASGSSTIHVHSTGSSSYPLIQTLPKIHPLGCHHITCSPSGTTAISVGFGGEVLIWHASPASTELSTDALNSPHDVWTPAGEVRAGIVHGKKRNPSLCWAVSLSSSGRYLAGTSHDGRLRLWDLEGRSGIPRDTQNMLDGSDTEMASVNGENEGMGEPTLLHEFETRGGFGMGVDFSPDDRLVASVHQSGSVYLFATGFGVGEEQRARLLRSLPSLHAPGRTVRFSPAGTLLAAAGDSGHVALYSIASSPESTYDRTALDQIAILRGHASWITGLDWSSTGEWIASCAWDGKVRVWSTERRECVSTLRGPETPGEGTSRSGGDGGPCWAVKWLPTRKGGSEGFVVGGRKGGVRFYREAAGG